MSLLYAQPTPTSDATSGAVRSFVVGTFVGFVVVGGFCGAITALFGGGLAGALAVGAFCGFWGGPGFGGMMGFVVHRARTERHEADEAGVDHPPSTSGR
jgi:hypothetical protein